MLCRYLIYLDLFLFAILFFLGVTKVPFSFTSRKLHNSTSRLPPSPARKSIQFSWVSLNLSPGPFTSLNKHLFSLFEYLHKHKSGIPPVRCPYSSENILQIWLKLDAPMHYRKRVKWNGTTSMISSRSSIAYAQLKPTHHVSRPFSLSWVRRKISGLWPFSISARRALISLLLEGKKASVARSSGAVWYGVSKTPGSGRNRMSQNNNANYL